ncbi:hypothetical protein [Pseudomonas sp. BGI-2]|uniref:hypothetical protein n=1 Tax=Pseudomonas sp. BGI-2 TaxID=2528211 RepID=UPI0010350FE0|nr:hypothetical protein [Pseudomonas sp. BGI-2]TBN34129.1 hypothetical protein EYC95_27485 [Pseudomonas sp. BGI-2]
MSYPEITEYQGWLIYKHDPADQKYCYQVYSKDGSPASMLCETKEHAEQQIRSYKPRPPGARG